MNENENEFILYITDLWWGSLSDSFFHRVVYVSISSSAKLHHCHAQYLYVLHSFQIYFDPVNLQQSSCKHVFSVREENSVDHVEACHFVLFHLTACKQCRSRSVCFSV